MEPTQRLVEISTPDGQLTRLRQDSVVNCVNLVTLERTKIHCKLGTLPSPERHQTRDALVLAPTGTGAIAQGAVLGALGHPPNTTARKPQPGRNSNKPLPVAVSVNRTVITLCCSAMTKKGARGRVSRSPFSLRRPERSRGKATWPRVHISTMWPDAKNGCQIPEGTLFRP
jgi:hypothetical protein